MNMKCFEFDGKEDDHDVWHIIHPASSNGETFIMIPKNPCGNGLEGIFDRRGYCQGWFVLVNGGNISIYSNNGLEGYNSNGKSLLEMANKVRLIIEKEYVELNSAFNL